MTGITVGFDGSPNARRALEWALEEAALQHTVLTVATVHEVTNNRWTGGPIVTRADRDAERLARQNAGEAVTAAASQLGDHRPTSIRVRAMTGFAAPELIGMSRVSDLLVLGAHGAGGLNRLLAGSVSDQVVHHAACPVIVVPADYRSQPGHGRAPGREGSTTMEPTVEQLTEDECFRLISPGGVGRLAFTGRYGLTVFPVNYKVHDGSVMFRTADDIPTGEDLRTGIPCAEYKVAFEVDAVDETTHEGWSVLIHGPAHHMDTCAERDTARQVGIEPWVGGKRDDAVSITPTRITGRRIRHGS